MKLTPQIGCAVLAFKLASVSQAASVLGTINFSSGPNGGVILQDLNGNVTTNLAAATGVQAWLVPEVDGISGSFISIPSGQSVAFTQPWIFNPSTSTTPLWMSVGFGNFTFDLSMATIAFQDASFLLISGTGTITGTNFDPTPAIWTFATEKVATESKFAWSGSVTAVPEIGTTALLSGALIGICFRRGRTTPSNFPQ